MKLHPPFIASIATDGDTSMVLPDGGVVQMDEGVLVTTVEKDKFGGVVLECSDGTQWAISEKGAAVKKKALAVGEKAAAVELVP